jgi:hypothetical protein
VTNSSSNNESLGLCSTCSRLENCSARESFKGEILQCKEFDDYKLKQSGTREKVNGEKTSIHRPALKGLYMNCDLAGTCILPKLESGVWFCNEYQ